MKQLSHSVQNQILVGIGTNQPGRWGSPLATLSHCLHALEEQGFSHLAISSVYRTRPVGVLRQPDYLNLVLATSCDHLPRNILRIFKTLERAAGRRSRVRNGPRPLDLDLLAYRNWVVNWPPPPTRPSLIIPHPLLDRRAFVLVPLAEIAPTWRHPVHGETAAALLARLGGARHLARTGEIVRLDCNLDL